MPLYLVQHGKSLPKDMDPKKGLSQEGIEETKRIAQVAAGYKVPVTLIAHSGKTRARQTAEIFTELLKPEKGIEEQKGLKPMDDVTTLSGILEDRENLMLVGHLPFMERLTSFLITGDIEKPVFKFQNSGIVCLDKALALKAWVIKWTLMPDIG